MGRILTPHFNSPLDPRKTQGLVAFYSPYHQQAGSGLINLANAIESFPTIASGTWSGGGVSYSDTTARPYFTNPSCPGTAPITLIFRGKLTYTGSRYVVYMIKNTPDSGGLAFKALPEAFGTTLSDVKDYTSSVEVPFGKDILCAWIIGVGYIAWWCNGVYQQISSDSVLGSHTQHVLGSWINEGEYFTGAYSQIYLYKKILPLPEISAHMDPNYLFAQRKIYGFVPASGGGSGMFHFLRNSMNRGYM